MEQEFVTSVCVFLPPGKLVVDGQGNAFLEPIAGPRCQSDDITVTLETKGHIKVFRDMPLGPEFFVAILIFIRDLLDSRPAKNSVMANKGSDITIRHGVLDGSV